MLQNRSLAAYGFTGHPVYRYINDLSLLQGRLTRRLCYVQNTTS